jgi:hypothetical protein
MDDRKMTGTPSDDATEQSEHGAFFGLTDRRSFAVQDENIVKPKRRNAASASVAVQKLDLDAVRRQDFDHGPHVADLHV